MGVEQTERLVRDHENVLVCPICLGDLQVKDLKSIICPNRPTLDFAKQGYVIC